VPSLSTFQTNEALKPAAERVRARVGHAYYRGSNEARYLGLCFKSGLFGVEPPQKLVKIGKAFIDYGMLGALTTVAAIREPGRTAIIDELGTLTYGELEVRTNAIANAWIKQGLKAGEGVAILTRNHRGFIEALIAAAKCGARVILMNTGFSGPQIREVALREGTDLIVYDEEYLSAVVELEPRHGKYRAWLDTDKDADDTLAALIARSFATPAPPKPARAPRLVILTSGTTGTPKGAGRDVPWSLSPVGGPLTKVPFRSSEVTEMCAPMFHALGFSQMLLAIGLRCTLVLQRRFDPEAVLESIQRHGVTALVAVPVMLQRMLALPEAAFKDRNLKSLRIIYVSGSQLGIDLTKRVLDAFGPVLYNLYGSTEITFATIATPQDLQAEPGCVGTVVPGAVVKILGPDGEDLPTGETGRIFVGNVIAFEGYTGGADKERAGALVSSGDVGHFDTAGRLFIDGRDDEMIISGGENVFPREVEELLGEHPAVLEAACIGVPDPQFGQRLVAFVVLEDGAEIDAEAIKQYVREHLARYKVPREVTFLPELPRNQTGKILKRELLSASAAA
jgi:fatty-acyl-CoA synthase